MFRGKAGYGLTRCLNLPCWCDYSYLGGLKFSYYMLRSASAKVRFASLCNDIPCFYPMLVTNGTGFVVAKLWYFPGSIRIAVTPYFPRSSLSSLQKRTDSHQCRCHLISNFFSLNTADRRECTLFNRLPVFFA